MPASPFTGPVIAQAARSGVGTSLPGDGWPEAALGAAAWRNGKKRSGKGGIALRQWWENQPENSINWLIFLRLAGGGALLVEQLAEHRVDIFLVAYMLHGEVFKGRLQMFIFTP